MTPFTENNLISGTSTVAYAATADNTKMNAMGSEAPMRVLMNHIYEYQKGVRRMVLYTFNKRYERYAIERLRHQGIDYIATPVGNDKVNLFFGRKECLDTIRLIATRPLNELSPEEDFILGALLGYDICMQCERYCSRKQRCS